MADHRTNSGHQHEASLAQSRGRKLREELLGLSLYDTFLPRGSG